MHRHNTAAAQLAAPGSIGLGDMGNRSAQFDKINRSSSDSLIRRCLSPIRCALIFPARISFLTRWWWIPSRSAASNTLRHLVLLTAGKVGCGIWGLYMVDTPIVPIPHKWVCKSMYFVRPLFLYFFSGIFAVVTCSGGVFRTGSAERALNER